MRLLVIFFIECLFVKEFWYDIEEWLNEKFGRNVGFNRDLNFFVKFENKNIYKIENLIIFLVK